MPVLLSSIKSRAVYTAKEIEIQICKRAAEAAFQRQSKIRNMELIPAKSQQILRDVILLTLAHLVTRPAARMLGTKGVERRRDVSIE
jgi:hypothetical protein